MYSQKGSKTPLFVVGVLMVAVLLMAACGRGRMAPQRAPAATATTTAAEPAATTAMTATAVMTEATAMTETSAMTEATVMTETSAMTEATTTDATALVAVMDDPTLGKILVDGKGMTLYMFDNDSSGKSNCDADCLKNWPALTVADEKAVITPGAGVTGDWAVITRDDGTYQVTVNGMPLYTYAKDTKAGDVVGQAVGDGWWVVSADGKKIDKQ